jgi:GT2 family glycosyltransferase
MKLTALIVTFNRLAKLKQCWFMTASIGFTHIIIVDNASTDGTGEWLAKLDDPRLILLSQQQNIGGAGGFKLGASYASEQIGWYSMTTTHGPQIIFWNVSIKSRMSVGAHIVAKS